MKYQTNPSCLSIRFYFQNVQLFPWLEPPTQQAIDSGLQLLQRLGAISIVPQPTKSPLACNGVATTNTIPCPIKVAPFSHASPLI